MMEGTVVVLYVDQNTTLNLSILQKKHTNKISVVCREDFVMITADFCSLAVTGLNFFAIYCMKAKMISGYFKK